MNDRWSLWTGGLAARNYIQGARRELRGLGLLVPASLRGSTTAIHLVVTALVGVVGSVLGTVGGVTAFVLVNGSGLSGAWMPLPELGAFLAGCLLPFYVCVRLGYMILFLVYRRALRSLAAGERSSSVSSSGSAAIPGSGVPI